MSVISRASITLSACVFIAMLTLALTNYGTKQQIADTQEEWQTKTIMDVLPDAAFDSDPISNSHLIADKPFFSKRDSVSAYPVFVNKQPFAAALSIITSDGYNGEIKLLLGVTADGTISGVRVISHQETPGLGDDIEIRRSNWILDFDGKNLRNTAKTDWAVSKHGGSFDAFTGATITPRAVINVIYEVLVWYENNRGRVFRI